MRSWSGGRGRSIPEAKLPKHRIVTRRVLLLSLVLGLVLAVASVPVAAVVLVFLPPGNAEPEIGFDVVERQPVLIRVHRYPTAAVWMAESMPLAPQIDAADAELNFGPGYSPGVSAIPEMSGMAVLPDGHMWVARAGWPMHAATAFKIEGPPQAATGVVGGLAMTVRGDYIVVPYVPLARGAIANTVFYAALTFVVIAGLGLVRTRQRRARGQCLACGYKLDDGMCECPECGLAAHAP